MKSLILLSALGVLSLLAEIFNFKKYLFTLVIVGILGVIAVALKDWNTNIHYYSEMFVFDNFAISFSILVCIIAFLWLILAKSYFIDETNVTDHISLVLFCIVGSICMIGFNNMVLLFIGIEILSLSLYVMAGSKKNDLYSNEAALKYFLMGSFATGFLLFGIALIYGASGTFHLHKIAAYITETPATSIPNFFYLGVLFMLVGMGFKVAAAPFHFWAPDVYQGSPTVVTAFMATVVKTAAFASFYKLFSIYFGTIGESWKDIVSIMSVVSLLIGNLTALYQKSIKRMLAFSSIAHAGYMLLALLANQKAGSSVLFYSASYSIATLATFTVLFAVLKSRGDGIDGFNGIGSSNPFIAFVMSASLFSLAGIPPMAGFFAKYFLFVNAIQTNYTWLVIIAVIGSLISVVYYFKIIIAMYLRPAENSEKLEVSSQHKILLLVCLIMMLGLGFFSDIFLRLI